MKAAPVLLVTVALMSAAGQLRAGERALGVGLGLATGPDLSPDKPLYLTASWRQSLAPRLAIEPEVGWYRQSRFGENSFSIGSNVLVVQPWQQAKVWAGAGPTVHLYSISQDDGYTASGSHFGFHLVAGVDRRASDSASLFGAARYEVVYMDHDYTGHRWMFYVGLRFGR